MPDLIRENWNQVTKILNKLPKADLKILVAQTRWPTVAHGKPLPKRNLIGALKMQLGMPIPGPDPNLPK